MSCSECSDMVRVWKKRSKKKMVKYLGRKGIEVNGEKGTRIIDVYVIKDNVKVKEKKKVVQNIFGNYYF